MFDLGWSELLVIGVVALIVIGPKDLPGLFRQVGKFTARARSMAREFQTSLEAAADESGVKDLTSDLKKMTSVKNMGLDTVKDLTDDFSASSFASPESGASKSSEKTIQRLSEERQAARKSAKGKKAAPKPKSKSAVKSPPASKKTASAKSAPKKAAPKKAAPKKAAPKKAAPKKAAPAKAVAKKSPPSAAKKPKAKA